MNGTFTLEIELGNAAMETAEDVADALERVASRLRQGRREGLVVDTNGNTVGSFSLNPDTNAEGTGTE